MNTIVIWIGHRSKFTVIIEPRHDSDVAQEKCTRPIASFLWNSCAHACSSTNTAFHLTLATLLKSSHPCCLSNVKQRQMMSASVASVKWNAAYAVNVMPIWQ